MASLDIDELRSDTNYSSKYWINSKKFNKPIWKSKLVTIKKEAQLIDSSSAWKDTNLKS